MSRFRAKAEYFLSQLLWANSITTLFFFVPIGCRGQNPTKPDHWQLLVRAQKFLLLFHSIPCAIRTQAISQCAEYP